MSTRSKEDIFLGMLAGEQRDPVERLIESRDWTHLAKIHPKLAGLEKPLRQGLADVLRGHQNTFMVSSFYMEQDQRTQMISDLQRVAQNLLFVANAVFMPKITDGSNLTDGKRPDILKRPHIASRKKLAVSKRGMTFKGAEVTDSEQLNAQALYRVLMTCQLAAQVDQGDEDETQSHPIAEVVAFCSTLRTWAERAERARIELEKTPRNHTRAKAALAKDLWNLWKPHLIGLDQTTKGRPVISSPNSPLFKSLVDHLLSPMLPWRKRKKIPAS